VIGGGEAQEACVVQPAKGPAPVPAEWHEMQLLVMPVCSVDELVVSPAVEKSPGTTWQVEHVAIVVGMWPLGLIVPVKKFVPMWHCEQSPLLGCPASATLKVPAAARGRVWKPVYCALATIVVGAIG
jgi:hypothetical protein